MKHGEFGAILRELEAETKTTARTFYRYMALAKQVKASNLTSLSLLECKTQREAWEVCGILSPPEPKKLKEAPAQFGIVDPVQSLVESGCKQLDKICDYLAHADASEFNSVQRIDLAKRVAKIYEIVTGQKPLPIMRGEIFVEQLPERNGAHPIHWPKVPYEPSTPKDLDPEAARTMAAVIDQAHALGAPYVTPQELNRALSMDNLSQEAAEVVAQITHDNGKVELV